MTNIIHNKSELMIFKDILNYFQNNEISKEHLEEVLKKLIPNDNGSPLISYNVSETGIITASFAPRTKSINMSINKVNIWLEEMTNNFITSLKPSDYNVLRSYMLLFIITHEIEHSYQYLISEGIVNSPNDVLKEAYKGLFELYVPTDYVIPRTIKETRKIISFYLYNLKPHFYLLERNANIESTDLVSQCALYNDREDIYQIFTDMKNLFLKLGYFYNSNGSIKETYKQILMYNKYKEFYTEPDIDQDERVRYGFSVSQETRDKILSKSFLTRNR